MNSKQAVQGAGVSRKVDELATISVDALFERLGTTKAGLSEEEAERRLDQYGPNEVAEERARTWVHRLFTASRNPLVILLTVLATISYATGDLRAGSVMRLMVILGLSLRFLQESRADAAAAKLKAMISVTATVIRNGKAREIPISQLVPGDIVQLSAGDMIPADVRLISAKDLFIIQATLTGESLPVEKIEMPDTRQGVILLERHNVCFLGTSVESGTAKAVVIATGPNTYFGHIARSLEGEQEETSFDRGIKKFTWLMIRFVLVMVPLVFVINGLTKHNWREAFFFSMAVAVGLTPEMLPMIVSVCLSKGAMAMSRKKVIVKRLNAIQNFGAMDVFCTDKTGTLTMDHIILELHCNIHKEESAEVLCEAYIISHFQTGLKNVLDRAVLKYTELHKELSLDKYRKVDEIPFDFSRRMMSVVVDGPDGERQLLTKGAPEAVFKKCAHFEYDGEIFPMEPILVGDLLEERNELNSDGFRVLAVAKKKVGKRAAYSKADEDDLVLTGYLAFLDPPKETAARAISVLNRNGVTVKVLTGDNDLVTRKVCTEVGLKVEKIPLGNEVEKMSDEELSELVDRFNVFARLSPAHKQRIVKALQKRGHTVGFMGDGINDAPALRAADVGISVDSAVDIAKESADLILLEKDLLVLEHGVLEGRRVFGNIVKYIKMGTSSNFGNMFSVLGASAFLPFLPMLPIQILTQNLLYDFSQLAIPFDRVDEEYLLKPRQWRIDDIRRFMLFFGPVSSVFDYATFALLFFVFRANVPAQQSLFQSGWFVEGLLSQTLIVHMIRTRKIPYRQSSPSLPLALTTAAVMAVGIALPFSPFASSFGMVPLPSQFFAWLLVILLAYAALAQIVKSWYVRRYGYN